MMNTDTHPAVVQRLRELRDARREISELSTEIDREAKDRKEALRLKESAALIEDEIMRIFNGNRIPTALFPNGDQLQRVAGTRVEVEDWPTFMAYVMEQKNWQLVQQKPGKNAVVDEAQRMLDQILGTLPGNEGATILDYFKPETEQQLPPLPKIPGVKIVGRYSVKDAPKRGG